MEHTDLQEKLRRVLCGYAVLLDSSMKAAKHGGAHVYDRLLADCFKEIERLRVEIQLKGESHRG